MKVQIKTSLGLITAKLNAEEAPKTVENFMAYVEERFYEGTIFHRVIDDFMIQGGGLDKNMKTKPARKPIQNEANSGLNNEYGTIAMARTGDPHSASSQFFINTADNAFLDFRSETREGWGYCAFGKVVEGMEVVDNIEGKSTTTRNGHQDVPEEIIEIESINVVKE